MRRKEHLLLYMAEAAVLPAVMNFPRPELQETCRGLGSSPPKMPAHYRGVQATFDHTWQVQVLQVFVFLLSPGTEFLSSELILRTVRESF